MNNAQKISIVIIGALMASAIMFWTLNNENGHTEFELYSGFGPTSFVIPNLYLRERRYNREAHVYSIDISLTYPSFAPFTATDGGVKNKINLNIVPSVPMDHQIFLELQPSGWLDGQPPSEIAGLRKVSYQVPKYLEGYHALFTFFEGKLLIIKCISVITREFSVCHSSYMVGKHYALSYAYHPSLLPHWEQIHSSLINLVVKWANSPSEAKSGSE